MNKYVKHSIYSSMENVDRACVHAVIMIDVIFAVCAYMIYPVGIWDIPLAELTAGPALRMSGTVILGAISILIFIDVLKVFTKR